LIAGGAFLLLMVIEIIVSAIIIRKEQKKTNEAIRKKEIEWEKKFVKAPTNLPNKVEAD
jgi:hypothetical protein